MEPLLEEDTSLGVLVTPASWLVQSPHDIPASWQVTETFFAEPEEEQETHWRGFIVLIVIYMRTSSEQHGI